MKWICFDLCLGVVAIFIWNILLGWFLHLSYGFRVMFRCQGGVPATIDAATICCAVVAVGAGVAAGVGAGVGDARSVVMHCG